MSYAESRRKWAKAKDGKAVNLGPLGKIRPAVSGRWVEKAEDLALSDLTPKVNYVPSDELKAAISGAKLGWTTEAGTEDDNENGGDAGDDNTNGAGQAAITTHQAESWRDDLRQIDN